MNSFLKVTFLFLSVLFFCTSCATIFNGRKQKITIDSKPQGATVKIRGKVIGNTPLTVKESPKKPLDIVFAYPGYAERTVVLKNKFEWRWFLLDAPVTYAAVCIPFAIDLLTQAPYRFADKKVMMDFDSVYVVPVHFDSLQTQKRNAIDQEILETERQIEVLKKQERIIFVEQERKRKLRLRQDKIRAQWMLDSTIAEHKRRSYDSSRAHNTRNTLRFKNAVTMELSSLLVGESRLEYHRNIYKGISLGVELGYKPSSHAKYTYSNQREWQKDGPAKEIMVMPFTESYYVGLATKIPVFNLGRGQYYFSLVSFLRKSSYDHATVSWQEGDGKIYSPIYYKDSVGVDQNTYGLKVLFGYRKIMTFEKVGLEFDTYAGFSCRNVTTELFHYEKTRTEYSHGTSVTATTNEAEKIVEFIPTVQAGVKVGIRF
jgi:hypothetical protein